MTHRFREPFNGFSHLFGAALACGGVVWMMQHVAANSDKMASVIVYGFSLIAVFLASAAYHLWDGTQKMIQRLQKLDHAAIYLVIAGSYTPICYNVLTSSWRLWLLAIIWVMALAGIIYKLLFLREPGIYSLLYYLAMGLLGLTAVPELIGQLPESAAQLLLIGGGSLIIGALVFGLEKPNLHRFFGHHELWHVFVLIGCGFHFVAIAHCIL